MIRAKAVPLGLSTLIALAGCGGGPSGLYGVSGTVTFKKQPLDTGTIQFVAADPAIEVARGTLIKDGRFAIPAAKGLPPGSYRVKISAADEKVKIEGPPGPESNRLSADRIPAEYNAKTKLIVEVRADGENKFDFDIP